MSQLITTYLQDHLAGSTAGIESFDRVAEGHSDEAVRSVVAALADEIRADKASLEGIMERIGAKPSTVKNAGAWLGEKAGRLKPNERLAQRSPLSDLVELEMLVTAVHGKGLLWKGLVQLNDQRLDLAELEELARRADHQEATLEELRRSQLGKLLVE
ncbi:MAG: hypothetical protein WAV52_07120 [Luteococcus japonicus]